MSQSKSTESEGSVKGPGRPTDYSPELADLICARLADGKSLRRLCLPEDMPDRESVRQWLIKYPEFSAKYAQAREDQAEFHHDEMDEIEGDVRSGLLSPQAGNVILGNKRWRMEKLKPKAYGQKLELDHTGSIAQQTDAQLDSRITLLLAKTQETADGDAGNER